jgi:hypothetical protein
VGEARGIKLGIDPADPAAILGDDRADPEAPDHGKVFLK